MEASGQTSAGILPDIPTDTDSLGFAPYANTLRDLILDPNTRTPLTVGIFGSWGSGKTSLMRMVRKGLMEAVKHETGIRPIYPIWFNAWLYSKEQSLWRALIVQVLGEIRKLKRGDKEVRSELNNLSEQLYRAAGPSELGSLSITAADLLADPGSAHITLGLQQGIDLLVNMAPVSSSPGEGAEEGEEAVSEGDQESRQVEAARLFNDQVRQATTRLEQQRIESLEEFQRTFQEMVETHIDGFLVVFVDDLDRCLPEKAVEILEAIKLFMDAPGCIFILGIDRDVVERGIRLRYGEMGGSADGQRVPFLLRGEDLESDPAKYRSFMQALFRSDDVIDGGRYLEKIIQVPFTLPPIKPEAMGRYIAGLKAGLPDSECGQVFARGLEPNPRQVKRAINIFTLLWNLSENRKHELGVAISPVRLAKLVVIQQRFAQLYQELREEAGRMIEWENWFRGVHKVIQAWQESSGVEISWSRWFREARDVQTLLDTIDQATQERFETYQKVPAGLLDLPVEEWPALATLLTMHPPDLAEYNFAGLSISEMETYVFLTRTIHEAVTPGEATPAEADEYEAYLPEQAIPVESGLDLNAIGYITAKAFSAVEELDMLKIAADAGYGPANTTLAAEGAEIFTQLQRAGNLPEELLGDNTALVHIPPGAGDWQIPWEIVYDQEWDEMIGGTAQGFWGFRHIIQRPLRPLGGVGTKMAQETALGGPQADIVVQDKATVLLAMDEEWGEESALPKELLFQGVKPGLELVTARGTSETLRMLQGVQAELVIFAGRGYITGGEINLMLDDENVLTRRILRGMGADKPGWSSTSPGSALFYMMVGAELGRSDDWPVWLDLLYNLGAGGVIAPVSRPVRNVPDPEWPVQLLEAFLARWLEGKQAGIALREARRELMDEKGNPLGLTVAHYGPTVQRLVGPNFGADEEVQAAV